MRLLPSLLLPLALNAALTAQDFVNYESPQVHPLELSADGSMLFVANTPDNRLAIFSTRDPKRPVLLREVAVGLEPVTVRARDAAEVWVVNYLSDSISVVDVGSGRVLATILVEDEPADVAFAGGKAFVSVSGSDEVRVFDAVTRQPLATIAIFGDEPRTLLGSPDGKTVWTVVHRSGNDTTMLDRKYAPAQPRPTNRRLPTPPRVGKIIDSEDPAWASKHNVVLPDFDLVELDVATLKVRKHHRAVGTINTGAALRPGTSEVWVANIDARNTVSFVTNLRGHAWDNRVTRVVTSGSGVVTPFDLNPGIDYSTLPNTSALSTALAQPQDVVWDATGKALYVAAFGTDRIGIVDAGGKVTGFVEVGDTAGTKVDPRRKRGPRGLALHKSGVLFVSNRLSNSVTGIDVATRKVLFERQLKDPTPAGARQGRGFLYDAKLSGNGTFSCASCHVDGDTDGIAWDLGDPGGTMFRTQTGPVKIELHPMKGPMLTQTLKGLQGIGPFHWRGDKPKLQDFNATFDELMGGSRLSIADMDAFAAFMETIAYPPNPNRTLSNELPSASAKIGENLFKNVPFAMTATCTTCHALPTGTDRRVIPASILGGTQAMKSAQLRNVYKRTGFRRTAQGRKSGYGLTHEGILPSVFEFLSLSVFGTLPGNPTGRGQIQDFVMAFDTGTPPAVGHQVQVDAASVGSSSVLAAAKLLQARAEAGDVDLVVKGRFDGRARGLLYDIVARNYIQDQAGAGRLTWAQLVNLVKAGRVTFVMTGVARFSGRRIGIDRDRDGVLDGDEGVHVYGAATKGCGGVPLVGPNSEPHVGNGGFALLGSNAPASGSGFLALGLAASNVQVLGMNLLVDLANPAALVLAIPSDANGELRLSLPIPDDPTSAGLSLHFQLAWRDRCATGGLSATRGLRLTVTK